MALSLNKEAQVFFKQAQSRKSKSRLNMSKLVTVLGSMLMLCLSSVNAEDGLLIADNFVLIDHLGKAHELYYHRHDKAVVIVGCGEITDSQRGDVVKKM